MTRKAGDGFERIQELAERFNKLHDKIGRSKSSSGTTVLTWTRFQDGWTSEEPRRFSIELGGYDIGDWNRHTELGQFKTIEEAADAMEKKVLEAEEYAKNYKEEDNW